MESKSIIDFFERDKEDFELKEKFLLEANKIVPFEGLKEEVLQDISSKTGYNEYYYKLIFPEGIKDFVKFYEDYAISEMLFNLSKMDKPLGITSRVELALNMRILESKFSKLFIKKIAEFYLKPQNISQNLASTWKTVSAMWYWAGDQALDYNYYTKRSLLAGVYVSSMAYFIASNKEGDKTKEFIAKSLAKVSNFAKLSKRVKGTLPKLSSIAIIRMFF